MEDTVYTPLCLDDTDDSLQEEIRTNCNIDVDLCLECGKCSGGCPNGHIFDYTPRKIVRLVKLGDRETVMTMDALWICLSCQACLDRCPSGIDIPAILDYMREKACRSGVEPSRPRVRLFHELMLSSVREGGRVSEMDVVMKYNSKIGEYMKDARLGFKMLLKGKLSLTGSQVKKRDEIRRLFEKSYLLKDLPQ
jgi:heterodisulfide reductase subunit C